MEDLLTIIGNIGNFFLPIFVFLTMFNVGLTQDLRDIWEYVKEWPFYARMLLANFVAAPLVMYLLLQLISVPPGLEAGLIIFSMAAGAPFLIKLTEYSDHDIALGASLMLILVLATSAYLPVMLPLVMPDVSVSASAIFFSLARQLVLPVIIGMLLVRFASAFAATIQPWVAKLGTISLYIVIIGPLLGNFQGVLEILGEGAILISILFVLIVTVIGYFLGGKNDKDHLQDIGALGTGQRNTSACLIVATSNFAQTPEVLIIIILANTLGILMLLLIAKYLSKDNERRAANNG